MLGLVSQKRFDNLQKEHNELSLRLEKCREIEGKNQWLQKEIFDLQAKIRELEGKIREQTEADLFFISAKIQKKLLDGEPKENLQDLRQQQLACQNQLEQMQASSSWGGALGGLANILRGYY